MGDSLTDRRTLLDAETEKVRASEREVERQRQLEAVTPLDQCRRVSGIPLELMDRRIQRHPPTGMMTGVEK